MTQPVPQPAQLAKLIEEARTALGMSQRDLARRAEVSNSLIQQIEAAGTGRRRATNIRSIARVLGIDERVALTLGGHNPDLVATGPTSLPVGRPTVSERQLAERIRLLPPRQRHIVNDIVTELAPDKGAVA